MSANASFAHKVLLSSGNFIFKYRNGLFPLVFAVLFLFSKPQVFLNDQRTDLILTTIGIVLAFAGVFFRLLVIGYAYIKRGGVKGKVFAERLVVRGFFAHTRNPMYLGNILIVVGACLVYGSLWAYFAVIPFFCFAYLAIVVAEETYLAARFGKEYEEYTKNVNRFWPNFHGLRDSLKEFQYDWKRALRKDYGTTFCTGFFLLLVVIWKRHETYDTWDKLEAVLLNPIFTALLLFYVIARILKKSGRLASTN